MSMAWERTHRRYELTQVLADVAQAIVDDHHRTTLRAATGVDQPVAHLRTRRVS